MSIDDVLNKYLRQGLITEQLAKEISLAAGGSGGSSVDLATTLQNGGIFHYFNPSVKLDTIRANPAGSPAMDYTTAIRIVKGNHVIDTFSSTATAGEGGSAQALPNRVVEYGIKGGASAQSATSSDVDPIPFSNAFGTGGYRIRMWMNMAYDGAQFGLLHTGTSFVGFEIGTFGQNAPWSGNADGGMLQVRHNLTGARTTLTLCSALNNSTGTTLTNGNIKDINGVNLTDDSALQNAANYYLLDYYPGSYIDIWIGGQDLTQVPLQRVIHITNPALIPPALGPATDANALIALVQNTGSGATGGCHQSVSNWYLLAEKL